MLSSWSRNHPKTSHDLDTMGSQVIDCMAEREGFEPSIRCYRIHTFQACSFNHSDTSPENLFVYRSIRSRGLPTTEHAACSLLGLSLPSPLRGRLAPSKIAPGDFVNHSDTSPENLFVYRSIRSRGSPHHGARGVLLARAVPALAPSGPAGAVQIHPGVPENKRGRINQTGFWCNAV